MWSRADMKASRSCIQGSDEEEHCFVMSFGLGVENCNKEYVLGYRETGEVASGFGIPSGMCVCVYVCAHTCTRVGRGSPNYNRKEFFA